MFETRVGCKKQHSVYNTEYTWQVTEATESRENQSERYLKDAIDILEWSCSSHIHRIA